MQTFSITDLCQKYSTTRRALRFYEERRLLSPARAGPDRIYSNRDRVRLELIHRGKRYGFSLREIGEFLDLYDANDGPTVQLQTVLPKMRSQLKLLKQDHETLSDTIAELEGNCHVIEDVLGVGSGTPTPSH